MDLKPGYALDGRVARSVVHENQFQLQAKISGGRMNCRVHRRDIGRFVVRRQDNAETLWGRV
jgi:hypothetical protein